jgi:O-antigen/teichoic acid export membrane protein
VLRWQMLGDVLKIASWPIGFLLMASGRGGRYVFMEALAMGIFVASTMMLLDRAGIAAAGVAYLLMYIVYFGAILAVAHRLTHFRIGPVARNDLVVILAAALFVFVVAAFAPRLGVAAAFTMSVAFALRSYLRLRSAVSRSGPGAQPPS